MKMAKISFTVMFICLLLGMLASSHPSQGSSVTSTFNRRLVKQSFFVSENTLHGKDIGSCLQKGIKLDDVVSTSISRPGTERGSQRKVTVEQTLRGMKARCRKGKLVDARGREIYFYSLTGCWGNPPPDYQEILSRQNEELRTLRKRYHVVEMTCNPEGIQIN